MSGALGWWGRRRNALSWRWGSLSWRRMLSLLSAWRRWRRSVRRRRRTDLGLDDDELILVHLHPARLRRHHIVVEIDSRTKVLRIHLDPPLLPFPANDDRSPPVRDRLDDDGVGGDVMRRMAVAGWLR